MGIIAELVAAYPRFNMTEATLTKYYERLHRFRPDQIRAAMNKHIDECDYFPEVSKLIRLINAQPPPRLMLLDAPKISQERVAQNRHAIDDIIKGLAKKVRVGE